MIKPIKIKVRPTGDTFLIHDTKWDVRRLAEAINSIIVKQNEIIDELNMLHLVAERLDSK